MSIFSRVPTKLTGSMKKRFKPESRASFNFGGIYPILCKNVMPGDTWSMNLGSFIRTVPLISPVMHRNDLKIDAFYVPYRIIWPNAERWFACEDGVKRPQIFFQKNVPVTSTWYDNIFGPGSLHDYFNFGTPTAAELSALNINLFDRKVDAMPMRAYQLIYDYYFRNKAIEDPLDDGFYGDNDNVLSIALPTTIKLCERMKVQFRPWRRDIFTSSLPDPQNGPDVVIPQADLDVEADGDFSLGGASLRSVASSTQVTDRVMTGKDAASNPSWNEGDTLEYSSGLKVSPESIPTMRKLRAANLMEEFEEAMARIGYNSQTLNSGKFKEWLSGIWNVRSSDGRLDIPEWLGGYRGPITISEIPQTSGSTENSPQGNLAGKGLSAGGNRLFKKKFFEEPGILMVLCSVVPKSAYCQGDPREWLYESGFDYPNPYFEGLGEQEVKTQELNCLAPLLSDAPTTFGYNVRNYEMKSFPDEIHGKLRTDLAFWHEGRMFDWDNVPGLNKDFLKVHPDDVSRIFPSTEDSDKLIGQFFFDIVIKRRLNPYGIPHFTNF